MGNQIITAKHEILGQSVIGDCAEMIKGSRKLVQHRLISLRQQIAELRELRGLKEDSAKLVLAKVIADKSVMKHLSPRLILHMRG